MKTKSRSPQTPAKKQAPKLPKAKVAWATPINGHIVGVQLPQQRWSGDVTVAVLPLPKSRASLLVRVANMTEADRLEKFTYLISTTGDWSFDNKPKPEELARAVLEAFGMIAKGGAK